MTEAPKITLFLMTRKGLKMLEAIQKEYPSLIALVVGARDAGLEDDSYDDIKSLCERSSIEFRDRREEIQISSQYAFAVSWRWLLNESNYELIVFHDSLLPRYRGFNPLVSCLINGDTQIGVTALFASREFDTGDIIAQSQSTITYPTTIDAAIDKITENYVDLGQRICQLIASGSDLPRVVQSDNEATYSLWRDEKDYQIDWSLPAGQIRRTVDALGYPYKGASTTINGELYRIIEVEELDDVRIENRVAGKVLFVRNGMPVVVAGEGLVLIRSILDATGEPALPLRSMRVRFS